MSKSYWSERIESVFRERLARLDSQIQAERNRAVLKTLSEIGIEKDWRAMEKAHQSARELATKLSNAITQHATKQGIDLTDWRSSPKDRLQEYVSRLTMPTEAKKKAVQTERLSLLDVLHRANTTAELRVAIAQVETKLNELSNQKG